MIINGDYMAICGLIRACILLLSVLGFSVSSAQTIVVNGYGESKHKALDDALVNAVISCDDSLDFDSVRRVINIVNSSLGDKLSEKLKGDDMRIYRCIKSYTILEENKNKNEYISKVSVDISSSCINGDEKAKLDMKKITILSFYVEPNAIKVSGLSSQQISQSVQQGLVSQFTQSRKFRIIAKNDLDDKAYQHEVKMIMSGEMGHDNTIKLNSKIGADYIVTGEILNLTIASKKSRYYGQDFSKWNVSATVAYRLLDLETMEVKWANTVTENLPSAVATEYIENNDGSYGEVEQYLFKNITKEISDQIIGVVYPLTVLKAEDNNVYFNQGADRVSTGAIYNVYEKGSVVEDSATGQLITINGKYLATVRVSEVLPKYSVGKIVEGSTASIQSGDKAFIQKQ